MHFYSNGKLLLTGEYLVLEGAKALAIPTKFGQDLEVISIKEPQLIWGSFDLNGNCWFEAIFELPKLRLISATFDSDVDGNSDKIAETLLEILSEAKKLNPDFLNSNAGFLVKTTLTFPRNWGLGSSSTLINSIASWAKVDAFQLLWNSFKGSGYDIACAQNNSPIFYQLSYKKPLVERVDFNPNFKENLFFVHLNQKQDSKKGIAKFREKKENISQQIHDISMISDGFLQAKSLLDFEKLMIEHEKIISAIIQQKPVKSELFPDYFGEIKSLGAWGGDFVLATGNEKSISYFKNKGFETILGFEKMIL
ncbi:MAG: GHMP kinase [Flavobacteriia bacterium]|nr:GHMP kinase [Flavobacteriia bacterium]OIP48551.1 MAG: GHMP kinase [Flavobacteriaceae bacterium CG2_30_31_66]PIV97080.1 MAG: GHMP kinase [Flavobacteriaceae bacterium CG17_big_fil_post_rev_8_21_14_2_50_31_13]PIX11731.1 MAG: GHMP kinase [Flavobacteriaceae bacterium CG_4_8_14_3_um_filter_31_8]PIY13705.1 MAG: GHMP kinase [Flavobacteriaceae bacterium CG_4_10_14_3_um_filter_31_253]PIZ10801.1 MAG: GHMP kinase [Flavobacteriaceae bacterium CG_4_10_14_0_8_um_filter_31_99]PJC10419.1 MAG: GHMP kinase [